MMRFLVCLSLLLFVGCYAKKLSTGEDVATYVSSKIDGNHVMVFAKSYCGFCKRTRTLLTTMEQKIDVGIAYIDLDVLPSSDGSAVQQHLAELTGQRTVPNIFIGKRHVGGNSDLQQLHAVGQLQTMLLEASRGTEL